MNETLSKAVNSYEYVIVIGDLNIDVCDPVKDRRTLYKKGSFQLRVSSVNVAKSTGNCGFGHIYWKNP